jgi:hypothetical protein
VGGGHRGRERSQLTGAQCVTNRTRQVGQQYHHQHYSSTKVAAGPPAVGVVVVRHHAQRPRVVPRRPHRAERIGHLQENETGGQGGELCDWAVNASIDLL